MSRKHNTQHTERSRSHYADRLAARGLSKAPPMPSLEDLRRHQGKDWLERHPWVVANIAAYLAENSEALL